MSNIAEIDKNFAVGKSITREGVKFYSAEEKPFVINGVYREGRKFTRMPRAVAEQVSEGVVYLHTNTAGGRVRFKTDSGCVAISVRMEKIGKMPHFALTGSAGFDMYVDGVYTKTFTPPFAIETGYESLFEFPDGKKLREICINFPLYSDVCELFVGLDGEAVVEAPTPYINDKPVVYYGSSITQGGCASRPGMSYQAIVSRRLSLDYINLGFSGNARGELPMAEHIAGLEMSVFVYDYDHNAYHVPELKETHERMFKIIRKAHPELPVIMMPRPKLRLDSGEINRREIILETYNNALASGDRNVYYISNETLCELCGDEGTVDNCHPTDFGFASMAKAVGDVIEKILKK